MADPHVHPKPKDPPKRPRARKALLAVAAVLALLVTAGSAWSITTIEHVNSVIQGNAPCTGPTCRQPGSLTHVDTFCVRKACNFLILGSDTRKGLTKKEQQQFGNASSTAGQRSDTIMVVQVDPENHRTIVLSIPRDLRVPIPGHGVNKINTAYNYGPDTIVQTVEKLTGLHINHYIEVNFLGFQGLVNALGGVPVCIDKPMTDKLAGLHLTHKGCYNLKGQQALAFVRARHITGDTIPDFSRITRQQQFLRAVITKSLSVNAVLHINAFLEAAKDNLVIDKNLNVYDLQELSRQLTALGQKNVFFRVVPARPQQIGGEDFVVLTQPQASMLFERIRKGMRLGSIGEEALLTLPSPATITVNVYDAGSNGQAQQVVSYLQKAGFLVSPLKPAPAGLTKSALIWGHGAGNQEKVAASYLTTLPVRYDNAQTTGSQMTVVIGPDFKGLP